MIEDCPFCDSMIYSEDHLVTHFVEEHKVTKIHATVKMVLISEKKPE